MSSQEETIETTPPLTLADRFAFMRLPIEERRRMLAQQADELTDYYEQESSIRERETWQGGDICPT